MTPNSPDFSGNRLLAKLSPNELSRLAPHLKIVPLDFNQVVYDAGLEMESAHFPLEGMLSAILMTDEGDGIEVATVGSEGMFGLTPFARAKRSPYRVLVQGAGQAAQISLDTLREESERNAHLRDLMDRYSIAFLFQVSQSVACNGLHSIERRCCRWLLLSADRMKSDDLALTHEFLALMLGCRRATVTDVLQTLQQRGLIKTGRGRIHLTDRAQVEATSCECYRAVNDEYERLFA